MSEFNIGEFVKWTGYTWSVVIVREILPDNQYVISYADFYNKMQHTEKTVHASTLTGENRLTVTRTRVAAAEAALDAADATTIDNARVLYNAALHEMWQAMKAEDAK